MNQTEQIVAQSQQTRQPGDLSKGSFAPASALVGRVQIDFKKLQSFKGKSAARHCFNQMSSFYFRR